MTTSLDKEVRIKFWKSSRYAVQIWTPELDRICLGSDVYALLSVLDVYDVALNKSNEIPLLLTEQADRSEG